MNNNNLVAEVRKSRREILESYNGDFQAMMRDMMKKQWNSDHKVVTLQQKVPKPGVAPIAYPTSGQAYVNSPICAEEKSPLT